MSNVKKIFILLLSGLFLGCGAGYLFAAQTEDILVTVTVRNISLEIVGSNTYDFGYVVEGGSKVATSDIDVRNNGNDTEDFSLQITAKPAAWSVEETGVDPGADEFKLYGLYDLNGQVPDGDALEVADYDENDLILLSSARNATDGFFDSGDESADEETRHLWCMFKAPNPTSLTTQQSITVTVSASVD